jgi:hypothetical protein
MVYAVAEYSKRAGDSHSDNILAVKILVLYEFGHATLHSELDSMLNPGVMEFYINTGTENRGLVSGRNTKRGWKYNEETRKESCHCTGIGRGILPDILLFMCTLYR